MHFGSAVTGAGADELVDEVGAGRIGKLWALGVLCIGDSVGVPPPGAEDRHFPPPTLE